MSTVATLTVTVHLEAALLGITHAEQRLARCDAVAVPLDDLKVQAHAALDDAASAVTRMLTALYDTHASDERADADAQAADARGELEREAA